MAKKDNEFASQQAQPADDSAVQEKLDKKAEKGPPVAQATEVDTLGPVVTEEHELAPQTARAMKHRHHVQD